MAEQRTPVTSSDDDRLGAVLIRQVEHLRRLETVLSEEREALRTASLEGLALAAERKRGLIEAGALLERERTRLVEKLLSPEEQATLPRVRLQSVIGRVQDPVRRAALERVHSELRDLVARVQEASQTVVGAAQSLSRHVSGLMQSVHGAIGRATVYGPRGRMDGGSGVQRAVDLRS